MGYYFEHEDANGDIHTYYPGSTEFGLLDRGPQLTVVDPTADFSDFEPAGDLDYYAEAPGTLTNDLDSPWVDLLLALVQNNQEVPDDAELVGIETFALSPITSSTGLKGILLDILGPYDNIVTQYQYRQNTSTNYSYVNEVTPDYPWIASAALFIALVISIFGLLKRSMSWMK